VRDLVLAHCSMLVHFSVDFDFRPACPACRCSCFRQCLLVAYAGDCLLSIGCWTDRRHEWQTWQTNGRL